MAQLDKALACLDILEESFGERIRREVPVCPPGKAPYSPYTPVEKALDLVVARVYTYASRPVLLDRLLGVIASTTRSNFRKILFGSPGEMASLLGSILHQTAIPQGIDVEACRQTVERLPPVWQSMSALSMSYHP